MKNRQRFSRATGQGFTLIELMITVVIIGILAGIAYPGYRNYVTQTRRSDAHIALTRIAAAQEKFYSDCGYYAKTLVGTRACGTAADNADTVLGFTSNTSPGGDYTLSLPTAGGNLQVPCSGGSASFACGFTAVATPAAGGRQVGNGALRLDAVGTKQWDKANNNSFSAKWTDK